MGEANETVVCDFGQEVVDDEKELARMVERRAATYGMLSRLFRTEVDQELLDELKAGRFPQNTGSEMADEGYKLMAGYLARATGDVLTELAVDYVHGFIGSGIDAYSAAYPYESVYTSEKRLLMQEARDQVLAIYRSEGLDKGESWREGEDHVALELEFMQLLNNRLVQAILADDEEGAVHLVTVQKNFLEDHLLNWVPQMATDLSHFARTDLYKGLAYLTLGFLKSDQAFLSELLPDEDDCADAADQSDKA